MRKLFVILSLTILSVAGFAQEAKPSVGVVNFAQALSDSKVGKQEQASFESLKKQMTSLLEDTEKQLTEISAKFNDSEYMDGLSPEAEDELKNKFRSLSEEMNRNQNQYYQVLNQANMKVIQTIGAAVQQASEKVAKDKKLTMILNKEACFYYMPTLDVTSLVVAEMDKSFDGSAAKRAPTAAAPKADVQPVKK